MKNLITAMNNFGDGEDDDQENFDPEAFFSFGSKVKETSYDNPFATDNLAKVGEELEQAEQGGAQSINIAHVEAMTISEPKLEERTISTNNRFNSFESTQEPENATMNIEIEEPTPPTPPVMQTTQEPVTNSLPESAIALEVESGIEELSKIAEQKDSAEIANMLSNNTVEKTVLTGGISFDIEEEPSTDDADIVIQDYSSMNYINNNQEEYYTPPSDEQAPPLTEYEQQTNEQAPPVEQPKQDKQQEQKSTTFKTDYNGPTTESLPVFSSKFGPKFRDSDSVEVKEDMVNLSDFQNNKEVIGDVFVQNAKIQIYQETKKRVEYDLIIANKVRIKASQFNASPHIAEENLRQLIGNVYKIEGKWNLYQRQEGLVINAVHETLDTKPEDFTGSKAMNVYDDWYQFLVGKVKEGWIRTLIDRIMIGDGILDKMKLSPASLSNHDNVRGGLYMHSLKMTMVAYQTSLLYPTVNPDVIIASGLLHDIGKIYEIGETTYTDIGITTGHISLGHSIVREKLRDLQVEGIVLDERVSANILHCILSHHGKLEYGSPVTPKTREAYVIHLSDMMDTYVTHFDEQLEGKGNRAFSKMMRHEIIDLNIM